MQDQRTMRKFLNPPRLSTPLCFMLSPNHNHVTIRPQVAFQLPIFWGIENDNPYSHIKEFEDIVSIFWETNTSLEIFHMKLFLFSLKDKTKTWLNSLRLYSIGVIYNQCFFKNSFQHIRLVHWEMKSWISRLWRMRNFLHIEKDFREIVVACSHHRFVNWMLVSFLYKGMSPLMK